MAESERVDVVTLLWHIENFNELSPDKIESPVFLSNSLDRTRWKMCLYSDDGDFDDFLLSLTRCSSSQQEVHDLVLDCELSIIGEYGTSTLVSTQITDHVFVKNHTWSPREIFVSRDDVIYESGTHFIPFNVLHVRCKIWRSFNNTTLPELITHHTKIERICFTWKIENFSCLKDHEVKKVHVKNSSSKSPILSYRFYTNEINDEAIIEFKSNNGFKWSIWCEVIALNSTGERFDSEYNTFGSFTLDDKCLYERCLRLTLSDVLNNKALYLPMDALSLQMDIFYWSSDVNVSPTTIPNIQICENVPSTETSDFQEKAESVVLSSRKCDQQSMTEFIPPPQKCDKQSMTETENTKIYLYKNDKSCDREKCDVSPDTHQTLERFVQDMHGMFEEGLLSDFTLCSGNRNFPVHKSVLSARSPVFKAMFTTPLKEKDGKALDIPDIDADTLNRMLLFVYSSEVSDLEWEDAISLYFAADKYNIEDLKSITSSVLKSKLSVSNVCEILVHADLHEDQDLKSSAMEFIANNDDEILGNENWKTFQKKHMPLTMEILSVLYTNMKKRLA